MIKLMVIKRKENSNKKKWWSEHILETVYLHKCD